MHRGDDEKADIYEAVRVAKHFKGRVFETTGLKIKMKIIKMAQRGVVNKPCCAIFMSDYRSRFRSSALRRQYR